MNCEVKLVKSYLSRAQAWVDSLEDITIENIESIIYRFTLEVSRVKLNVPIDNSKLEDLEQTLKYLNGVMKELVGDEEPIANIQPSSILEGASGNQVLEFNASPLALYGDQPVSVLSSEDRKSFFNSLKASGMILTGVEDIKQRQKL